MVLAVWPWLMRMVAVETQRFSDEGWRNARRTTTTSTKPTPMKASAGADTSQRTHSFAFEMLSRHSLAKAEQPNGGTPTHSMLLWTQTRADVFV